MMQARLYLVRSWKARLHLVRVGCSTAGGALLLSAVLALVRGVEGVHNLIDDAPAAFS